MPIANIGGVITETPPSNFDQFFRTGVMHNGNFAICDQVDVTKQIKMDPSLLAAGTTVTLQAQSGTSGTVSLPNVPNPQLAAIGGAGSLQVDVPTEAGTVTIAANITAEVMVPAAGLTTLNLVLPTTPPNGFTTRFSTTATITNLNLSGGGADTIQNAITTLSANTFAAFIYRTSNTKWYRIG